MRRALALMALAVSPVAAAEPLKVALVSMAHGHAGPHLEKMLKSTEVRLVGVGESAPDRAARARKMGVAPELVFSDWREMIARTRPDFVWAFTENNRHLEVVEHCAPLGIHVMVEKPLAATHSEAVAIARLARKHGIQVFTNYSTAWGAANYAAKTAIDEGRIGTVTRLRTAIGHMGPGDPRKSSFAAWLADPVKNGGGALMDFGCYGVLLSLWMKGRPESVYATTRQLRPEEFPQVDDHATIVLNYKDATAILEASWNLPARPPSGLEIFGRKGSLNVMGGTVDLRLNGERDATAIAVKPLPAEAAEPLAYMADRLRTKRPVEGLVAVDINVTVNEVLDAAKASARSGRAVSLPAR